MQNYSLNKKFQSILALFVMFFTIQMSIPALALTFTDEHNLSLSKQNGDTYLILGHDEHHHHHMQGHEHSHHHEHASSQDISSEAKLTNHHSHEDHFIKLPKSSEITSVINTQNDTQFDNQINFDHYYIDQKQSFLPFLADSHYLKPRLYRYYESSRTFLELKNIIQFLV
jgi:hypothetical protein